MNKKELQEKIKTLTTEIEKLTHSELREYQVRVEAEAKYSSRARTGAPMAVFLLGLMGFTYVYFAVGQGLLAYFFIFGVATPGALWFMVTASRIPRWSRWRAKEETIKYLNQLNMEKTKLVSELRRLEREEKRHKN